MTELKMVRGFTINAFDDLNVVLDRGLNFSNDQAWNHCPTDTWPSGLAFDLWTPQMQEAAEWLAREIAESANFWAREERRPTRVSPAVGIITCGEDLFDQFREGLIGINRVARDAVEWRRISHLSEVTQFDEFTVDEAFLTPDWLLKLSAQVAFLPMRDFNDLEASYYDFEMLARLRETRDDRQRRK